MCGVCEYVLNHSVMSYSLRPHGRQPARLLGPWDFTGKNTEVGCHFLLQDLPDLGIKPTFLMSHVACMLNLFLFIEITGVFCVYHASASLLLFSFPVFYWIFELYSFSCSIRLHCHILLFYWFSLHFHHLNKSLTSVGPLDIYHKRMKLDSYLK